MKKVFFGIAFLILLAGGSANGQSYTLTYCYTSGSTSSDSNEFVQVNPGFVQNETYFVSFEPANLFDYQDPSGATGYATASPDPPPSDVCAGSTPVLSTIDIEFTIDNIVDNTAGTCATWDGTFFGNTYLDCSGQCVVIYELGSNSCQGSGSFSGTTSGSASGSIFDCNPDPDTMNGTLPINIDIFPNMFGDSNLCPENQMAISNNLVEFTFEVCFTITYDYIEDVDQDGVCADVDCPSNNGDNDDTIPGPPDGPCDDLDPLTDADVYSADGCECAGVPWDCPALMANYGDPCDNDPCMENETIQDGVPGVDCTCGGGTLIDDDGDGVCDTDDQCPGLNDALIGQPCNDFDPATTNDTYDANCMCSGELAGCTDMTACNYDPAATTDDGSCISSTDPGTCNTDCTLGDTEVWDSATCQCVTNVVTVSGCTDATACNYDASANCDDGSCTSSADPGTCNTDCTLGDLEMWDAASCSCVLDVATVNGCTDASACNYDASANCDDGSCTSSADPGTCNTDCTLGDLEMWDTASCSCVLDVATVDGCTDASACNYDASANCDDGSCTSSADPGTCNTDCTLGDLEIWDTASCSCVLDLATVSGCTDASACNYDASANCDDGSCTDSTDPGTCNTDCTLGDLEMWDVASCSCVLDVATVDGCTDATACNYDASANCDDGSCTSSADPGTCNTDCTLGDLEIWDVASCSCVLDVATVDGCTDATACNYDASANCDDGSCTSSADPGTCNTDCTLGDLEIWDVASCSCVLDVATVDGCTDASACNYDASANCDDGSCTDSTDPGTCNTDCILGDLEIWDSASCSCVLDLATVDGCTDVSACNYDASANCDDGSCTDSSDPGTCNTDCTLGDLEVWDVASCSCVLDVATVDGCTDASACNYDASANCDDGSCEDSSDPGTCNTDCQNGDIEVWNSTDCECEVDMVTVYGCTDSAASNYDPAANCDDDSCEECPSGFEVEINQSYTCNNEDIIVDLTIDGAGDYDVEVLANGSSVGYDVSSNELVLSTNQCYEEIELEFFVTCDADGSDVPADNGNIINIFVYTDDIGSFVTLEGAGTCTTSVTFDTECDGIFQTTPVSQTGPDENGFHEYTIESGATGYDCEGPIGIPYSCPLDCEGVPGGDAIPGSPCDDMEASTDDDVYLADCSCAGGLTFDCPSLSLNIGDPCDDMDNATTTDVVLPNCTCEGTIVDCPDPGTCNEDCSAGPLEVWDPVACSCVAGPDPVLGCTDVDADNYDAAADCDDGSCVCLDPGNCNTDCSLGDTETWDDVECECITDVVTIEGCTDASADNYDPAANCDDGSCDSTCPDDGSCNTECLDGDLEVWDFDLCQCVTDEVVVEGCTDASADNYDPAANCDDGSCDSTCPDDGSCNTDCNLGNIEEWDEAICDCVEVTITALGCTDASACNYDATANCDDDSCISSQDPGNCNTDCNNGDIEVWNSSTCLCETDIVTVFGCDNPTANNYDPNANCDDGSCTFDCPDDGTCNTDCTLGPLESWDGDSCSCVEDGPAQALGCTDVNACNYDPAAECDDGSCEDNTDPGTCNTDCTLGDLEIWNATSCECELDEVVVLGCNNPTANNFDPSANCDDGSCEFDCPDDGSCNTDCTMGDIEIWDGNTCECDVLTPTVLGCTDATACNYDPDANCEDGSCLSSADPGTCNTDCNLGNIEVWDSATCTCVTTEISVAGCTNATADNFDPNANCDDGSCTFDDCPDDGSCNTDCTMGNTEVWDGSICDCVVETVSVLGCTNPAATNYDENANCDDGSCDFDCPDDGSCNTDCTLGDLEIWNPVNCECEIDEVVVLGCTDMTFDNFNPLANCDDGSCEDDADCTDPGDCDDGDCSNGEEVWDDTTCACEPINIPDPSTCVDDDDCTNGFEVWDEDTCTCETVPQIEGCTNETADNYDPAANCDDGSCTSDCPDPMDCDDADCSNGVEFWDFQDCECKSQTDDLPDPDSCVNDGDCTNGFETWDDATCECEIVPPVFGCTEVGAENFDPLANCSNDGSCIYCDVDPGNCDDGDCTNGIEIWSEDECMCVVGPEVVTVGCTDANAENYDPDADCDDGSCIYDGPCPDPGNCNTDCSLGDTEVWDDTICSCVADGVDYVDGCTDITAENYDASANCEDGSCTYLTSDELPSMPTAFSPNGDGFNDVFRLINAAGAEGTFIIYDRWGNLVYESQDLSLGWNGTRQGSDAETGVYVYVLQFAPGSPIDKLVGNVTLIR